MGLEHVLPFTAQEIEEKLNKVDEPVSWNDLNDRPFGEFYYTVGDTVTWDGNRTNNFVGATATVEGQTFTVGYELLSSSIPTPEELIGSTVTYHRNYSTESDGSFEITEQHIAIESDALYRVFSDMNMLLVVGRDSEEYNDLVFPRRGIYAMTWITDDQSLFVSSLHTPGYDFKSIEDIKGIDTKYLPQGGFGYESRDYENVLIEYDGNSEGKETIPFGDAVLVKLSNRTPDASDFIGAEATVMGQTEIITSKNISDGRPVIPMASIGNMLLIVYETYTYVDENIVVEPGMYVADIGYPASLRYKETSVTVNCIDPKFLPEGIGYEDHRDILPETVFEGGDDDGDGVKDMFIVTQTLDLEVGETYNVRWNGVEYTCIGQDLAMLGDRVISGVALGNSSHMGGSTNTGEPFIIAYCGFGVLEESISGACMYIDGSECPTVSITSGKVHKIDPKYLPEGIGYVSTERVNNTLTWDGTPTDICVSAGELSIYHISDSTPTAQQMIGGTFRMSDQEEIEITEDMILSLSGNIQEAYAIAELAVLVTFKDNLEMNGFTIPKKGIYFLSASDYFTSALTIPNYVFIKSHLKKIDPKFLPQGGFGYEYVKHAAGDTLRWNGLNTDVLVNIYTHINTDGSRVESYICLISDKTPTIEQLRTGTITWTADMGVSSTTLSDASITEFTDGYSINGIGLEAVVVLADGATYEDIKYPKKGIYFSNLLYKGMPFYYIMSLQIPGYNFAEMGAHKIDNKFLPDMFSSITEEDDGAVLIARGGDWIKHKHKFGKYFDMKDPTSEENGIISRFCSECGFTETFLSAFDGLEITELNREQIGYTGYPEENLVIPERVLDDGVLYKVTSIGQEAFEYCENLTSVVIPDGVTSIGIEAFTGCDNLKSIKIPTSVTSIEVRAFQGCNNLTDITLPNGINTIDDSTFNNCTSLTTLSIPPTVKSINYHAFNGCTGLTSITIPNSVTSIGQKAFYDCSSLKSIIIPNGVTHIDEGAFSSCDSLTSIDIPASVTSIGPKVLAYCENLNSIVVDANNNAYHSENNCLINTSTKELLAACRTSVIPNGVVSIGPSVFGYADLTDISIPDSVISIGDDAFHSCKELTSIILPDSVISIGISVFSHCDSLKNATLGNGLTSIGQYAFSYCTALTSITIPDGVTRINTETFNNCSSLASVTIPSSLTSIGIRAFNYCNRLTDIYYTGTEEQWNAIEIDSSNDYWINKATIHYNYTNSET